MTIGILFGGLSVMGPGNKGKRLQTMAKTCAQSGLMFGTFLAAGYTVLEHSLCCEPDCCPQSQVRHARLLNPCNTHLIHVRCVFVSKRIVRMGDDR